MIAVSVLELVPSAWRAAPRPAVLGCLGGWCWATAGVIIVYCT
jgi:hypothetical protein